MGALTGLLGMWKLIAGDYHHTLIILIHLDLYMGDVVCVVLLDHSEGIPLISSMNRFSTGSWNMILVVK